MIKIVDSLPLRDKIRKCVTENAIYNIPLIQDSLRQNCRIYFSSDKGNKKGNKSLAKFICWYNIVTKELKQFLLDVDCTDESTEDILDAMMYSLKRIFPPGTITILWGQFTDSGGGGTKSALARDIFESNLAHPLYLIGTCLLHTIQTWTTEYCWIDFRISKTEWQGWLCDEFNTNIAWRVQHTKLA